MESNTRVTSSQLLFEWNACGQSSFLQKSGANFVSLQTSSGLYEMSKGISPPVFVKGTLLTWWNGPLWDITWVFSASEIPHHRRLHWSREAAMPAGPAHGKPLLGLSPVGISADGSGAHAAISFQSLHSLSRQQLSSDIFNLDPQEYPGYCNMVRFGIGTLHSNVKDNAVLFLTMSYQTRWQKETKKKTF